MTGEFFPQPLSDMRRAERGIHFQSLPTQGYYLYEDDPDCMTQLDQKNGSRRTWRYVLPGIAILLCVLGILSCGCTQTTPTTATPAPTASPVTTTIAQIANPAAEHCYNLGGTYQIRTNPDGSQYGVCILPGGQVCDAMKYMQQCVCVAPATP